MKKALAVLVALGLLSFGVMAFAHGGGYGGGPGYGGGHMMWGGGPGYGQGGGYGGGGCNGPGGSGQAVFDSDSFFRRTEKNRSWRFRSNRIRRGPGNYEKNQLAGA